ncbi:MAG TPA: PAS domain-containing protein, partial [Burkholderiales bacterium]|nr:PAS domain-containing protein [Burkholderiales bacterium]
LRASEQRYAHAMEGSDAGHWDWDLVSDQMFVSERAREMLALPAGALPATCTELMALVPMHPDDRASRLASVAESIASGIHERDYRVIPRDGEWRWLRSRGKVFRDASGAALRMTGSLTDITERKRAAEALRLSEQRYARAMDAAEAGHWEWNVATDEMFVSARQREMLELPAELHFGNREAYLAAIPFHRADRERFRAAAKRHIDEVWPRFEQEFRVVVKGDETRWMRLAGKSHIGTDGKPTHFTGSLADITDQKRAEELLAGEKSLLEMMARATPLATVLDALCRIIEESLSGCLCGITLVDATGTRLEHGAAPSLPREYVHAIHGRAVDRDAGPCGMAASLSEQVISADVATENRWVEQGWRALALAHGLRSCWSTPIVSSAKNALGTFAIYFRHPSRPTREHQSVIERFTHLAAVAIERSRAEEALRLSEERHALAMRASGEGHWDWKIGSDEFYASPRYLEIGGFAPDFQYSRRADIVDRIAFHPDDRANYQAAVAAHFAGETPRVDIVLRLVPHGELRWVHVIGMCLRDGDGTPVRWAGSVNDITDRKLAEEARQLSEERYALAMEASDEGHFDWNVRSDEVFASARMKKLLDLPADVEFRRRDDMVARVRYYPGDRPRLEEMTRRVLAGSGLQNEFEYRILRGEEVRWLRARWKIFRDAAGAAQRVIGVLTDITERKKGADALRESEARFRGLTALSSDWYWRQDENLRFTYLSADVYDLAGYSADSSVGKARWELAGITPLSTTWEAHKAVLEARQPFRDVEYSRVAPDGRVRYISVSGAPLFDQDGTFLGYEGVGRDITERKRIEAELRSRQEMLEVAQKAARAEPWEWINDAPPEANRWSPELEAMFGLTPGAYDGTASSWWKLCHPEDVPRVKASIARARATGEIDIEYRVIHPDGKVRWLHQKGRSFFGADGRPVRSIGFMFDVTERHKVEDDLRSRQEMLELAQKSARAIAFEWKIGDGEGENRWSSDLEAMYGFAPGTYDGTFETWKKRLHPQDWPAVKEAIRHAQRTGEVASEYRVLHPDGSVHWLQARGRMFFDASGSPTRMVGFMQDVTQRKQAEEELRKMELELRRAQRLEAMGTLAGGIAHDFNNILGAIVGYGEMALRDAKKGTRLRRDLDAIMAAGERGRSLVDRILAFSRSGVGERMPVHVEEVVREALDQLAAKLPENVTIAPRLHAGRAAMLGDSTQVHQVVMNLANNAVQAMPHGGVLRVALETVRLDTARSATVGAVMPGEYIVLRLSDSGTGISPAIFERMFDPFFTTKEVGVGSGLGLSLVHGIVANVGGAIDVTTELGKGSSFTVYLPRSGDAPAKAIDENRPLPRGEGERVLVVDDE